MDERRAAMPSPRRPPRGRPAKTSSPGRHALGHRAGAGDERPPGGFAGAITVLVQRCAAGEPAAMGRLYDATAPMLYRAAYAATGEQAAACRLTRAVYLRAWQASPTYRRADLCAVAWLLRILREQVTDHTQGAATIDAVAAVTGSGAVDPAIPVPADHDGPSTFADHEEHDR